MKITHDKKVSVPSMKNGHHTENVRAITFHYVGYGWGRGRGGGEQGEEKGGEEEGREPTCRHDLGDE